MAINIIILRLLEIWYRNQVRSAHAHVKLMRNFQTYTFSFRHVHDTMSRRYSIYKKLFTNSIRMINSK